MRCSLQLLNLMIATSAVAAGPTMDERCAHGDVVNLKPAELLDLEDNFRVSLPPADRALLDTKLPRNTQGRIASCAQADGATCDAQAYVVAFNQAKLMPRFLATLCPHG